MRPPKMKGNIRFLESILLFGPYKSSKQDSKIIWSAQRHIALTTISLQIGNSSSTLRNTIFGSLVGENCILLCKFSIRSLLMTVFLRITSKHEAPTTVKRNKQNNLIQVSCYVKATVTKTIHCC